MLVREETRPGDIFKDKSVNCKVTLNKQSYFRDGMWSQTPENLIPVTRKERRRKIKENLFTAVFKRYDRS